MNQTATGLGLAGLIVAGWAVTLGFDLTHAHTALSAFALICLQTWLNVGLFIVAHDAMHGSLAPGRRWLNRGCGRLCLILYAGFAYPKIEAAHFRHHRYAGSAGDPDFSETHPDRFWPWFSLFMRRYFGLREFCGLALITVLLVWPLHRGIGAILLYWALPAVLSSVQLFLFGTYLPHRHGHDTFLDRHNARSLDYPWALSLLACFHFGYHHEHHLNPSVPWWKLPSVRRSHSARSPA